MPVTGWASGQPARAPKNGALNENTPPSFATSQYPTPFAVDAIATIGRDNDCVAVDPWKLAVPKAKTSASWADAATAGFAATTDPTTPDAKTTALHTAARKNREHRRIRRRLAGRTVQSPSGAPVSLRRCSAR